MASTRRRPRRLTVREASITGADGKTYRPILRGEARRALLDDLAASYEIGSSIRDLVEDRGLPFGTVRLYLAEAGVTMRPRGDRYRNA